jgi:Zinc knuckle
MDIDTIKTGKLSEEEKTKLSKEGRCFRCKKLGHISRNCPDKGKNYKPRNESGQYVRDKPKARVTEVEEPQEDEVEEEPKEKPPAYMEKGIMEFIRTMKADKCEALYEAMSLQAEDF